MRAIGSASADAASACSLGIRPCTSVSMARRMSATLDASGVHLLRRHGDVDADAAADSVRVPFRTAVGVAPRDEAVSLLPWPLRSQPQKQGMWLQNLGMPRGKLVRRARDRHRPRRGELHDRQRRQLAVVSLACLTAAASPPLTSRRRARRRRGRRRSRRVASTTDAQWPGRRALDATAWRR